MEVACHAKHELLDVRSIFESPCQYETYEIRTFND